MVDFHIFKSSLNFISVIIQNFSYGEFMDRGITKRVGGRGSISLKARGHVVISIIARAQV